jgi:dynein heavy chain
VQPHLRKCFEAIDKVTFLDDRTNDTGLQMTVMHSGEGETVTWDSKVVPEGSVEHWLTDVETMMRRSVNSQIGE